MDEILALINDPAFRLFGWAAVGLLLFEAIVMFIIARRFRDKEIHAKGGSVVIRSRNAQTNTGSVGDDMRQDIHEGEPQNPGENVSVGLVLNIAGSISSIASLALAIYLTQNAN